MDYVVADILIGSFALVAASGCVPTGLSLHDNMLPRTSTMTSRAQEPPPQIQDGSYWRIAQAVILRLCGNREIALEQRRNFYVVPYFWARQIATLQ
jgi:hypothetical protein